MNAEQREDNTGGTVKQWLTDQLLNPVHIGGLVVLIALGFFLVDLRGDIVRQKEMRRLNAERGMAVRIIFLHYMETGVVLPSSTKVLAELGLPINDPAALPQSQARLVGTEGGKFVFEVTPPGQAPSRNEFYSREEPAKETKLRLNALAWTEEQRQESRRVLLGYTRSWYLVNNKQMPEAKPPSVTTPKNRAEAEEYLREVRRRSGGKLLDGWGRELVVKLDDRALRFASRGADGRLGTQDDLNSKLLFAEKGGTRP